MHIAAHCITNLDSFYAVAIALRKQGSPFIDVPDRIWNRIREFNSCEPPEGAAGWLTWIWKRNGNGGWTNCNYVNGHSQGEGIRVIIWPATLDKPR